MSTTDYVVFPQTISRMNKYIHKGLNFHREKEREKERACEFRQANIVDARGSSAVLKFQERKEGESGSPFLGSRPPSVESNLA